MSVNFPSAGMLLSTDAETFTGSCDHYSPNVCFSHPLSPWFSIPVFSSLFPNLLFGFSTATSTSLSKSFCFMSFVFLCPLFYGTHTNISAHIQTPWPGWAVGTERVYVFVSYKLGQSSAHYLCGVWFRRCTLSQEEAGAKSPAWKCVYKCVCETLLHACLCALALS